MSSIQGTRPHVGNSPRASPQGETQAESGAIPPEVTIGDLVAVETPIDETACGYPDGYHAKHSLRAADRYAMVACVGSGVSGLAEGIAFREHSKRKAVFIHSIGGIGLVASLAALRAARHSATQCLAQANKALALAARAECGVAYQGWPDQVLDHEGICTNQQGSVPVTVATNELDIVVSAPTFVLVRQCPATAITVVTLAQSRDSAAASLVADTVVEQVPQALAALARSDDPCQVRAAMKQAIQMPKRTHHPGFGDTLTMIADDAIVETTTIAMHKNGPAVIGHIGRARAILCENGLARPLTLKHTLDDESERARASDETDPFVRSEGNLSRGLVKGCSMYKPSRAQVTFVPRARYADAAIVLLSRALAEKLNDAEVAEHLKGVALSSPEACKLTADLVSLGRQRGGVRGLEAAVVPYAPGVSIDYSKVVPRRINSEYSGSRTPARQGLPPALGRQAREGLDQSLLLE